MKKILKKFYNSIEEYSEIKKLNNEFNNNNIYWIPIFKDKKSHNNLGITCYGDWVVEVSNNIHFLNNEKSLLYCISILENPFEIIKYEISEEFKDIINDYNIEDIFPFYEIIEFVFNNMYTDYWFELAMLWYQYISYSKRMGLLKSLELISINKKYSQKNRQKVKFEVKMMKEYINIHNI